MRNSRTVMLEGVIAELEAARKLATSDKERNQIDMLIDTWQHQEETRHEVGKLYFEELPTDMQYDILKGLNERWHRESCIDKTDSQEPMTIDEWEKWVADEVNSKQQINEVV